MESLILLLTLEMLEDLEVAEPQDLPLIQTMQEKQVINIVHYHHNIQDLLQAALLLEAAAATEAGVHVAARTLSNPGATEQHARELVLRVGATGAAQAAGTLTESR